LPLPVSFNPRENGIPITRPSGAISTIAHAMRAQSGSHNKLGTSRGNANASIAPITATLAHATGIDTRLLNALPMPPIASNVKSNTESVKIG